MDFDEQLYSAISNYDKKSYLELLQKYGTVLSKERKIAKESSNSDDEDKNEESELLSRLNLYSIILTYQLNWEVRDQYVELLKKFTEKTIDLGEFRRAFLQRYQSIKNVADILESNQILLSLNKNSVEFADVIEFIKLIEEIDFCCEAYCPDKDPFQMEGKIGDAEFTDLMEEIYKQNFNQ